MYLTKKEIFEQYDALQKTYNHILSMEPDIREFYEQSNFKSITYIGCGSSYCLCQSAEISANIRLGLKAYSIPAGDLMLNYKSYKSILKDTMLVVPSRSGSTSEVLKAVELVKSESEAPCISICAKTDSELSKIADLNIEIPWAFDESVCQTRTVTNLYLANLMLNAIYSGDKALLDEMKTAIQKGNSFIEDYRDLLKEVAEKEEWSKVVVLADSELQGIASEAALAFTEISLLQSSCHHLLDVRHGPIVLINDSTLVIAVSTPYDTQYQTELVKDLKKKGAKVVLVSSNDINWGADYTLLIPGYENYAVHGIPFIFVCQAIAYYKAVAEGINPDIPQGLDPWIKL
jgi:fructoselysine-6-P-deglycase FrlB-like protein